jgi:hypothetical protein
LLVILVLTTLGAPIKNTLPPQAKPLSATPQGATQQSGNTNSSLNPNAVAPPATTSSSEPATQSQPSASGVEREPQLRRIAEFSGRGIKTTGTFTVNSSWRISWGTIQNDFGAGNFQIYVYDAKGDLVTVAANVMGESEDYSIVHQAGTYYLTINSTQPYIVEVDELV